MKFPVAVATVAAFAASSEAARVKDNQWVEVHNELRQCLSSTGFCFDLTWPRYDWNEETQTSNDQGLELNFKTKEACQAVSLKTWVEPAFARSPEAFREAVEAADSPEADLFILRRKARLPVTGGLTKALAESVDGTFEGYVRCGGREYVYLYGERDKVYSAVGDSVEKILGRSIRGFDLALPVPPALRIDPYAASFLEESLKDFKVCRSSSAPATEADDGKTLSLPTLSAADCDDTIALRMTIAGSTEGEEVNARRLASTEQFAAGLEADLNKHGRSLFESDEFSVKVSAVSRNSVVVSNLRHDHARALGAEGILQGRKEVVWVEVKEHFSFANLDASIITQSGNSRGDVGTKTDAEIRPFWAAGITGKNQIVGVGDSGLATEHCHFFDPSVNTTAARISGNDYAYEGHRKLVNYMAYADGLPASSDHGTHVAGTIAGNAAPFAEFPGTELAVEHAGAAPDAKISFFDIGYVATRGLDVPDDIENDFLKVQHDHGAFSSSNSWGVPVGNSYSSTSRGMDKYVFENQDFVVLVAAGNSDYRPGSSGSLGSPASAKNCITVGAAMTSDSFYEDHVTSLIGRNYFCSNFSTSIPCQEGLASFTSNGPTFDGRIKPDVVAPGFFVYSTNSDSGCGLSFKAGTSMATPAVAGTVALIRQYLEDGFYPTGKANAADGFKPMGALLKAIAINSGKPMDGSYQEGSPFNQMAGANLPNNEYGFGGVQIDRTLPLDGHKASPAALYLDGDFAAMPQVDNWLTQSYEFKATGAADAKITLVWHDINGIAAAREVLVNDLDLEVVDSAGNVYYPNNNQDKRDSLNNVEQTILTGVEGSFTVRVVGYSVPFGPQPFALVVSGSNFEMTGKSQGVLSFDEIEGDYSFGYYLAWLFGGISLGGALFFGASKYQQKQRGEQSQVSSRDSAGIAMFEEFRVKPEEEA